MKNAGMAGVRRPAHAGAKWKPRTPPAGDVRGPAYQNE